MWRELGLAMYMQKECVELLVEEVKCDCLGLLVAFNKTGIGCWTDLGIFRR